MPATKIKTAPKTKSPAPAGRFVIVTTKHRGVFVGTVDANAKATDLVVRLTDALMVIKFGTTQGLLQLAATGPTRDTKRSAVAPWIDVTDVTSVIGIADAAKPAWEAK